MPDEATLIVEIAFSAALTGTALHLSDVERGILGTATLAPTDLWVDVTEWVTRVNTERGARRADGPVVQYEQGTCTITFRNDDRRFDPSHLAGPYVAAGVTQVEPLRAVRIRAAYGGRTYPLWRGFTNEWTVGYDGPTSSWASVTCFDAFAIFSANVRGASLSTGSGDTTGARVDRILSGVSWPASDRMVSAGVETVQATTLAGSVLTELQLTADTELGELWMDAEGRVTFRDRNASYVDGRSRFPLVHFGDLVADGDTTVNLASNPSLETVTAGWTSIGTVPPTIARDSTRAVFGTWSLKATWGTGGLLPGVAYDATGLTVGRTYTVSVYVYVPSGSPSIDVVVADRGFGGGTYGVVDQWVRVSWTGTAIATTLGFGIWPVGSPSVGQQVWIDGLQIEEGDTATAYVDGTQTGCEWDGVAHASTSRRLPELPASGVEIGYDAQSITNSVSATRVGGAEQTAVDTSSTSAYLTRSFPQSGLLMQTDAEALMWAQQTVARSARPEQRIKSVQIRPARDTRLWGHVLGREIGDRVRATKRPPGGGTPIVREGWVRGVEHEIVVGETWKTQLVLEQARDVTEVIDTYTRSTASSWGSADSGESWSLLNGTVANFSTDGDEGVMSMTPVNSLHVAGLQSLDLTNLEVLVSVLVPVTPAGNGVFPQIQFRRTDASNYYRVEVELRTDSTVRLILIRRVGGSNTDLTAFTTVASLTHSTTVPIWCRLQAIGTTVRARAWRGTEPTAWHVSATDTTLSHGSVALGANVASGNTNPLPVLVKWDNLAVTSLHAWS